MGISSLRPFLHSLCCNSPWNYAVFWKLQHRHEMILVWENGFSEILKSRDQMERPVEGPYLESSNTMFSSGSSSSVLDGTSSEHPFNFDVAEMSSASHVVGKGIIGKVAFTGNAHWVYSDSITTDLFNSVFIPEHPDEWLHQFAAGIKTILLLPVIPHGVLQLGSVEMVAEDEAFVAYVQDKFESLKKTDGYDWRYLIQQLSLMPTFMENLEEPSVVTTEKVIEDQNAIHAVGMKDYHLAADHMMPMFTVQDFCDTSMRQGTSTLENRSESEFSQLPLGSIHVDGSCQPSYEGHKSLLAEDDILKYIRTEERLGASAYFDNSKSRIYRDFMNELMDFHFGEGTMESTYVGNNFDSSICEGQSNFFGFPGDCELHKALGTAVEDNTNQCTHGTDISGRDVTGCLNGDTEPSYRMDVSGVESVGFPVKVAEVGHLLEAVVGNSCNSSGNNPSNKSNLTSLSMSLGEHLTPPKRRHQSKHSASVEEDEDPWVFLTSEFNSQGINTASNLLASVSSIESKDSASSNKQQQIKGFGSRNLRKVSRLSSTNKRRTCGGDNIRPRPRDRQLIQDRIKELRELVPNTEKCSIDGLLDKTVEHMLFLGSVINQADKLRRQDFEEQTDEKTKRTAEVNYSRQTGRSWAVELGSEQKFCPIIVKDLNHPGHLLIEMLCSDRGQFLEIADVIHRLQLTILKGVMEKGTDNSLARFVVETSGSFHRLDIFWPLMKLLQQSGTPISS